MTIYSLEGVAPELPASGRCWIAPGAHVIGRVRLGEDVSIWFGAILRGDNELIEIGDGTNIQDGAVLHVDPGMPLSIGAGCTIGHRAMLHGCSVGTNSLIGMSATVLNGARIGNNCLVGAGALVTEGKEFPDNSLIVGAPARAIRQLEGPAVEGLRAPTDSYIARYPRYAETLKPVG